MKTYMSILYFNTGLHERINVGLIMFNEKHCIIDIKQSKMDFVKYFKPEAFGLFEFAIASFKNYYSKKIPTHEQIKRLSIYNNGVFKLEPPSFISVELNSEKFNAFFDKHI
jgi:hypothetical protein